MNTKIVSSDELSSENLSDANSSAWRGVRAVSRMCFSTAKEKGWWDRYDDLKEKLPKLFESFLPDFIGAKLMLINSELSEALEEVRDRWIATTVYYSCEVGGVRIKGTYEHIKATLQLHCYSNTEPKPEGVPIEIADAIIRGLDLAEWLGIDIAEALRIKMLYNETRSRRHGGKVL